MSLYDMFQEIDKELDSAMLKCESEFARNHFEMMKPWLRTIFLFGVMRSLRK